MLKKKCGNNIETGCQELQNNATGLCIKCRTIKCSICLREVISKCPGTKICGVCQSKRRAASTRLGESYG